MSRGGLVRSRFALAVLLGAGGLLAANAGPAGAAVTIGQTFTPDDDFGGSGVFIQSGSLNNSYAAPINGVVTSWSFQAPAGITPPLKLKMMRFAGGSDFTTVGDSQLESPMPGILNTWPTRIGVQAGDVPAHFYSDTTVSYHSNVPGYTTNEISGDPGDPSLDPPPGTTITYEETSTLTHQLDLSAVIEPDADRDAFGDETQDNCLGTAGAFSGCPNTLSIGKLKQKGSKKVKVPVAIPGPGTLVVGSASDPALASASAKRSVKAVSLTLGGKTALQLKVSLKLTKSAVKKLRRAGKLKLKVKAVYTPPGGPAGSAVKKKKLKS